LDGELDDTDVDNNDVGNDDEDAKEAKLTTCDGSVVDEKSDEVVVSAAPTPST
jgi:hypothetical protein